MPPRHQPGRRQSSRRPEASEPPRSIPLLSLALYDAQASYVKLFTLATTHSQLIASRWRKKNVALRNKCLTRAWVATVATGGEGSLSTQSSKIYGQPLPAIATAAPKFSEQIFAAAIEIGAPRLIENIVGAARKESPLKKLSLEEYLYGTGINLDSMAQSPAPLLNFLHSRLMTGPAEMGRWDYMNFVEPILGLFGITEGSGWSKLDINTLVEVVIIGKAQNDYGLIKTWSQQSLDLLGGLMAKTVIPLEPQGKYLFRWQKIVTDFCLNCVLDILDVEARKPDASGHPAKSIDKSQLSYLIKDVEAISVISSRAGLSTSRAYMAKMKLYAPPIKFRFDHAYHLAITMLREAQDIVDLLRTEPSYLLDETSKFIEHRAEHITDLHGRRGNPYSVESVGDAVKKIIHNSYSRLLIWNEIALLFEDANEIMIDSQGGANETLDEIIASIEVLLTILESFLDTALKLHVGAGPQLRQYFQRVQTTSFTGNMAFVCDTNPASVYQKDPIAGIIMCSTMNQSWENDVFNLRRISDEVERELFERPNLKDTVHPWVMDNLGAAASVYELMDELKVYIPMSGMSTLDSGRSIDAISRTINEFADIMPGINLIPSLSGTDNGWQVLQKVETLPGGLEKFWAVVDREVAKLSKDGKTLADWAGASKGRLAKKRKGKWNWQGQVWFAEDASDEDNEMGLLDTTTLPELIPVVPYDDTLGYGEDSWLVTDDAVASMPARRHPPHRPAADHEPARPFGVNAEGSTGATQEPAQPPNPKKVKTRGITEENVSEDNVSPPVPSAPKPGPIFVSRRAHQLLVNLASESAPIAWKDFIYLMSHLGFSCNPVGGSAFRFMPERVDVNESISFHRPHPESEWSKVQSRWAWGRLRRSYGWDVERFAVSEKAAGEGVMDGILQMEI
ncbi:hypothetical protein EV426DRAFT_209021 [Tirmania nivea]|nr:hypothetical protein EV426DRAFT_209021 [Tirmania nivea]